MKILVLSHFHLRIGPKVFLSVPESIENIDLDKISNLLGYNDGFFIHIFDNIKSANLVLEIYSKNSRGSREILLISIVQTKEDINIPLMREILYDIAEEIENIPKIEKIFKDNVSIDKSEYESIFKKLNKLLDSYYKSLPQETVAERLQISEEKFKHVFEKAPDAIIWIEPETGIIINCNNTSTNLLGKEKSEIIGKDYNLIFSDNKFNEYSRLLKADSDSDKIIQDEIVVRSNMNQKVPTHISASLTLFGKQPIIQFILRDITELKKVEQKLRVSKDKYRNLILNISDIIIEINDKGKISYCSPNVEEIFGYTAEELIGKRLHKYVHREDFHVLPENLVKTLKTGERVSFSLRLINKDGDNINFAAKGGMYRSNGKVRMIGVLREVEE